MPEHPNSLVVNVRRIAAAVVLVLVSAGTACFALDFLTVRAPGEIDWMPSYDEALRVAKAEGRPVLVDFYTTWCEWCERMDADTYGDTTVARFLNEHFVSAKVDAEAHPDLADRHSIMGYPTVVILSPDGREVGRIVGYLGPERFKQSLEDTLNRLNNAAST